MRMLPVFAGFRRLQSFHIGILRVITVFWELERCFEDNNGIPESGTVFCNTERCSWFWNVVLALRMLPRNPCRYSKSWNTVLKPGMLPGNPRYRSESYIFKEIPVCLTFPKRGCLLVACRSLHVVVIDSSRSTAHQLRTTKNQGRPNYPTFASCG